MDIFAPKWDYQKMSMKTSRKPYWDANICIYVYLYIHFLEKSIHFMKPIKEFFRKVGVFQSVDVFVSFPSLFVSILFP